MDMFFRNDRGEGWVLAQFAVFVLNLVAGLKGARWSARGRRLVKSGAVVSGGAGIALMVGGVRGLGPSLSPFPKPAPTAELMQDGLYAHVRHPIYGSLMLLALSWALATSPRALGSFGALVGFFVAKTAREETSLVDRYPHYSAYRERVPRRFIPGLW